MTQWQHSESIVVNASPADLYDLVSDVTRTGEWSPVCRACWWADDAGPRPGAWFHGRNEADGQVWESTSQVDVADPGREFAWLVGGQYARWSFRLEAHPDGGTVLTESWHFLPAGHELFRSKYGDDADRMMSLRREQALKGIPATLTAIKQIAEAS